ncbi:MAG: type secretion control protein HpaP [Paraburkholderia sp.]|nr:type secretion control protein HpaP [Paraburkholderia sp.]
MHPTTTHRPRIIEGPSTHAEGAPTTSSRQMRSQAALFSALRARAAARKEDAARPASHQRPDEADAEADLQPDIVEACDQHGEDGNDRGDDDSAESGGHEPEASEHELGEAAGVCAPFAHISMEQHVDAINRACLQARRGKSPSASASASAATAPVSIKPSPASHPLIESIVAQVADFCSNPAVLARGQWHITIPIDSALLPGCSLSLTLSYFDLALRFETTDERSKQLILQHVATLRESLQALMDSRSDDPRNIEITVI